MNDREKAFFENMMKSFAGAASAQNAVVPQAQYDELKERLAKLEAMLAGQTKPEPIASGRRV
jgi:hypothetical protein